MKKRKVLLTALLASCIFLNSAFTEEVADAKFVKLEADELRSLDYSKSVSVGDVRSNHGRTGFDAEARMNVGNFDFVCKIEYIDSKKTEYYKVEDLKTEFADDYNFYIDINGTLVLSSLIQISWFKGVEKSAFFSPYGTNPVIAEFKQTGQEDIYAYCNINAIGGEMWGYKTASKVIAYSRTAAKINYDGKLNYFVRISGDKNHQYNWISAEALKLSEKQILALPVEDVEATCFNEPKSGEWYEVPENKLVVLKNLDADYLYNRDFLKLQPGSVIFAKYKSNDSIITQIPEWGYVSLKGLKKVTFPFGYEKVENSQEMIFICLTGNSSSKIKVYTQPSVKSKVIGNLDRARGKRQKENTLFDLVGCSTESQTINGKTSKWYYIDAPIEGKDEIVRGWVFGPEFGGNY